MERLSGTNLSSENNLPTFRLNASVILTFALMTTEAFSRNVGKLFSELKLVPDNLLFIYTFIQYAVDEEFNELGERGIMYYFDNTGNLVPHPFADSPSSVNQTGEAILRTCTTLLTQASFA